MLDEELVEGLGEEREREGGDEGEGDRSEPGVAAEVGGGDPGGGEGEPGGGVDEVLGAHRWGG